MTKSSVSQDESLLPPPEPREPCRKPAASAGEVSVLWSCCCISPRDGGEAKCEVELLLELLPDPELGYEGTGTGGDFFTVALASRKGCRKNSSGS